MIIAEKKCFSTYFPALLWWVNFFVLMFGSQCQGVLMSCTRTYSIYLVHSIPIYANWLYACYSAANTAARERREQLTVSLSWQSESCCDSTNDDNNKCISREREKTCVAMIRRKQSAFAKVDWPPLTTDLTDKWMNARSQQTNQFPFFCFATNQQYHKQIENHRSRERLSHTIHAELVFSLSDFIFVFASNVAAFCVYHKTVTRTAFHF